MWAAQKNLTARGKMRHRQGCGRDMPPEAVQLPQAESANRFTNFFHCSFSCVIGAARISDRTARRKDAAANPDDPREAKRCGSSIHADRRCRKSDSENCGHDGYDGGEG